MDTSLKAKRKAKGMSQERLAALIGRSTMSVRLYESGAQPIPNELREKIDEVLGPSHKAPGGSSALLPTPRESDITSASSDQERPLESIQIIQAAVMEIMRENREFRAQLLADNREIKESINKLADAILKGAPKPKTRK